MDERRPNGSEQIFRREIHGPKNTPEVVVLQAMQEDIKAGLAIIVLGALILLGLLAFAVQVQSYAWLAVGLWFRSYGSHRDGTVFDHATNQATRYVV